MKSIEERVAELLNCTMPEMCAHPGVAHHVTGCRAEMRDEVAALLREERAEAWRKAQNVAALWSVKPDRSLHPDIPWEQMNETAQTTAHSAAQQIAFAIAEEARAEAER